jgi:hypothetical protein
MSEHHDSITRDSVASSAGTLELVTKAARDGAADAQVAATRAWDASSLFASRLVYSTCYSLSYGIVFPAMLLARAIPQNNEAVRGLIDGAHAAILNVDQIRGRPIDTAVLAPSPA